MTSLTVSAFALAVRFGKADSVIYGQLMLLMQSVLFYRVLYRLPSDQTSCDFLPTGVGH